MAVVIQGLILTVVAYLCVQDREQAQSIAAISGNRHTAEDARQQAERLDGELQRVWREIAVIIREMAALPPDTFEAKVEGIIERVHQLELAVERLKK